MKKSKSVLDSQAIKDVNSIEGKLAKLTKVQLEQNQKGEHFSEETLILVQQYNEIVDALTKTFIEYDKLLTAAEENSKS